MWTLLVALLFATISLIANGQIATVDTLQQFSNAWNAHDLDALMNFMSEKDCEFHQAAGPDLFGKSWIGRDQVTCCQCFFETLTSRVS
jgi:ketosteroid isomerase-like protein